MKICILLIHPLHTLIEISPLRDPKCRARRYILTNFWVWEGLTIALPLCENSSIETNKICPILMTRSSGHKETFSPISGSGRVSLLPFLFVRILQSTLTENSILTTRSSEHEETFSQILVSWMVSLLPLRQNISFFLFFFKAPARSFYIEVL